MARLEILMSLDHEDFKTNYSGVFDAEQVAAHLHDLVREILKIPNCQMRLHSEMTATIGEKEKLYLRMRCLPKRGKFPD